MRRFLALLVMAPLCAGQTISLPGEQTPAVSDKAEVKPEVRPQDKCSLEGRVLTATGIPLRKASVSVRRADQTQDVHGYSTITDASGNFRLPDLDPGRYTLAASRNGYVRQQYGAKKPNRPGTLLTLAPGQKMTELLFQLMPQAVVTGRVVDADNEPLANANIQLMQQQYQRGKRELVSAGFATTNDLGEYRIFGVGPGRYFVNVTYRSSMEMDVSDRSSVGAPQEGYRPVYYPGVPDVGSAVALDVAPGGELSGINVTMQAAKAVRVRGRITGMAGQAGPFMVMLAPRANSRWGFVNPTVTLTNPKDATFEFKGVTPGTYSVTAMPTSSSKERLTGRAEIEVGQQELEGVTLALSRGFDVKGLVKVEGGELDLKSLDLYTEPAQMSIIGSGFGRAQPAADGAFSFTGMSAERVSMRITGLKGPAFLKTVRAGDQEITDEFDLGAAANSGLEIVVSLNGAELSGSVKGQESKPAAGAGVILVPDAEHASLEAWYPAGVTDQNGHFKIEGIRPGRFTVYAFEEIEPGAYMEPGFLKPFSKFAKEVELKEKDRQTVQLELIPASEMNARP